MKGEEVPLFSILCATYNHSRFLTDMLESVKSQTVDNYELIVVDDGSTDATPAVLRTWLNSQSNDMRSRTKTLRIEQSGQSAAWEAGFALTSGSWICFLDSDDTYFPNKLESIEEAIASHPDVGMIQHPMVVVDQVGNPTGDVRPQAAALSSGDLRAEMRVNGRHVAPGASGLVIERQTMDRLMPMPTKRFRFAADAYLSFGATALTPIASLPEPLSRYRMQPGGQYLKRMLSAEGLLQQVAFQQTVAGHFGLQKAAERNSFFCRNVYASRRFNCLPGSRAALSDLLRATVRDRNFSTQRRSMLILVWMCSALLPRTLFVRFWRAFQMRQTGWKRISSKFERAAI